MRRRFPFASQGLFALFFCMAASLGLATETPAQQAGANGRQAQAPEKQTATQQTTGQQKQATRAPAIPPGMRLLSLKEGRAIAQKIAWANDEEGLAPDCSHLVHDLYEKRDTRIPTPAQRRFTGAPGISSVCGFRIPAT